MSKSLVALMRTPSAGAQAPAEVPDAALVDRARLGDADAFMVLAGRYRDRIYGLTMRMTGNPEDAADLTQEAFLTAFRSLAGFGGRSSFYTWLYRIAMNLSFNFLRKNGRERDRVPFDDALEHEPPETAAPDGSPEDLAERGELRDRVEEAVASLPAIFRAAFALVVEQGMSHADAARVLECSENTVSWRMHKARKMLRDRLRPFLAEETP